MAQEYHNWITVAADLEARKKLASTLVADSPPRWDWVSITINGEASRGGDSGNMVLDFYSRGFPLGLEKISDDSPELTFKCQLFDISMPRMYWLTIVGGVVIDEREEEVEFLEPVPAIGSRTYLQALAKTIGIPELKKRRAENALVYRLLHDHIARQAAVTLLHKAGWTANAEHVVAMAQLIEAMRLLNGSMERETQSSETNGMSA